MQLQLGGLEHFRTQKVKTYLFILWARFSSFQAPEITGNKILILKGRDVQGRGSSFIKSD